MTRNLTNNSAALGPLLEEGAQELGVKLGKEECDLFLAYLGELAEWSRRINLTAIKKETDIVCRHFLDSLSADRFLEDGKRLLDIGSGAGFPGIPLKIVRPSLEVVLIDGVGKKVAFMKNVIRRLGLSGIEAVHGRIEEKGLIERYGGTFDVVLSRAFAELGDYLTLAAPYVKAGGWVIAVKGPRGDRELEAAQSARHNLTLKGVEEVPIPFTERVSHYILFQKGPDSTGNEREPSRKGGHCSTWNTVKTSLQR